MLLIDAKADLNAKQPDAMTALICAAFGGKREGARLLIQAGGKRQSKDDGWHDRRGLGKQI